LGILGEQKRNRGPERACPMDNHSRFAGDAPNFAESASPAHKYSRFFVTFAQLFNKYKWQT
jgi:hypothetical protein